MALVVLVLGALSVALFLLTRRKQRDLMSQSLETQARTSSYQVEMLTGMETLKAMGTERRAVDHWSNLFVENLNVLLAQGRLKLIENPFSEQRLFTAGSQQAIAEDAQGQLWLAAGDQGLVLLDPESGRVVASYHAGSDDPAASPTTSVLVHSEGDVWFGTLAGLGRLDPQSGRIVHYRSQAGDDGSLSDDLVL